MKITAVFLAFLFSSQAFAAAKVFGLIKEVEGKVFRIEKKSQPFSRAGTTVAIGDKILIEEGSLLEFVDRNENSLRLHGPCFVEILDLDELNVTNCFLRLNGKNSYTLNSPSLSGKINGTSIVSIQDREVQWLVLKGVAITWHPLKPSGKVLVHEGLYVESAMNRAYLEPRSPREPVAESAQEWVDLLDEDLEYVPPKVEEEKVAETKPVPTRKIASLPSATVRPAPTVPVYSVRNPPPAALMDRLQAKLEGREYQPEEALKYLVHQPTAQEILHKKEMAKLRLKRKKKEDAYALALGRSKSEGRSPASVKKPVPEVKVIVPTSDENGLYQESHKMDIIPKLIREGTGH